MGHCGLQCWCMVYSEWQDDLMMCSNTVTYIGGFCTQCVCNQGWDKIVINQFVTVVEPMVEVLSGFSVQNNRQKPNKASQQGTNQHRQRSTLHYGMRQGVIHVFWIINSRFQ